MRSRKHNHAVGTVPPGGLVESVDRGSPADRAGVLTGDRIVSLDGYPLRDVIDYQFHIEQARQRLLLHRDGEAVSIEIDNRGESHPGIIFSSTLFDGVRQCRCNCAFCFVGQLPAGLRESLYLKDDDYRLSFLYGNFVTLNNLEQADIDRIIEQRLSPLYVSVHATDADVRAGLMGCSKKSAAAGLDCLRLLGSEGIETHVQLVLCPGVNDGDVFERTVSGLAREYPGVASVGVVPVAVDEKSIGRSCGGYAFLRPLSEDDCRRIVAEIDLRQKGFRGERGYGFVYAADELYLRSGMQLPAIDDYDDLPQYENGVGIVASFQRQAADMLRERLAVVPAGGRVFLLTGTLALAPLTAVLESLNRSKPEWLAGRELTPLVAENSLFGPHVTVTGLLGGGDVAAAARSAGLGRGDTLMVPAAVLDSAGERFLDGLTLEELNETLDCATLMA